MARWPSSVRGPAGIAFPAAIFALGLAALIAWSGLALGEIRPVEAAVLLVIVALYGLGGAVAWRRRPGNVIGPLLLGVGFANLLGQPYAFTDAAPFALTAASTGLPEVLTAGVLLAYPAGRLMGRAERMTVAAVVALWAAFAAVKVMALDIDCPRCGGPSPFQIFHGVVDTPILLTGNVLQGIAGLIVLLLIGRRWLRATPSGRRKLAPVVFGGTVAAAAVILRSSWFTPDLLPSGLFQVTSLLEVAVPVALIAGFLRADLARGGAADMVVEFGDAPTLERIERVLRQTLHDPTLVIVTWSRAAGRYLDPNGRPVTPPVGDADRMVSRLERDGEPLAAIIHDPSVLEEPGLLAAASAALRLTLENEDLAGRVRRDAADVRSLPSGRVTFLLTDIEGSTNLLHRLGDRWGPVLAEQRGLVAAIVRRGRGREVDARADEYFAVFDETADAVASALAIQRRMSSYAWPDGVEVRLRVGIHTGEPELTDAGYVGVDVHLAARVCTAGHGGQILLTGPARASVLDGLPPDAELVALGSVRLRGIPDPQSLYQLVVPDLPAAFPPLRLGG